MYEKAAKKFENVEKWQLAADCWCKVPNDKQQNICKKQSSGNAETSN